MSYIRKYARCVWVLPTYPLVMEISLTLHTLHLREGLKIRFGGHVGNCLSESVSCGPSPLNGIELRPNDIILKSALQHLILRAQREEAEVGLPKIWFLTDRDLLTSSGMQFPSREIPHFFKCCSNFSL